MKQIQTILMAVALVMACALPAIVHAQDGINYQAVARDGSGNVLAQNQIDVEFTIYDGTSTKVFQEVHNGISTNQYGLFNLVIGTQNASAFGNIDWSNGDYQLQVRVDKGNGFVDLGTSDFQQVPYSLHSDMAIGELNNVNTVGVGDGQVLKWSSANNQWEVASDNTGGSGGVNTDATIAGDGANTPLSIAPQNANQGDVLEWNGSTWAPTSISSGSSVWSTSGSDAYYNSGNVAIGTSSSSARLHVKMASTSFDAGLQMRSSQGNQEDWYYYMDGSDNLIVRDDGSDVVTFENNSGNIGIGTASPSNKLQVRNGKVMIGSANGTISKLTVNTSISGEAIFRGRNNGTTKFIVEENGNVGINEASPSNALSVDGDANITGNLEIEEQTSSPSAKHAYGNSLPIAYGSISFAGSIESEYGIASVNNPTTGEYVITLDNDWTSNYSPAVMVTSYNSSPTNAELPTYSTSGTNEITVNISDETGSGVDSQFSIVVFGETQ